MQATREQLQLPTQVEAEDLAPQMQRANHTLEDPARRKTPEVRLTLRSVGWTGSEKATHEEGVVVDILVVDDEGRAEAMHAADYAVIANFDRGSVRLWQVTWHCIFVFTAFLVMALLRYSTFDSK